MIVFEIPGEPKAKQRARTTKAGHTYTPQDTVNYENWVKLCYQNSDLKYYYENEPLKANITVFFPIPKSKSEKIKSLMKQGKIRPTKKPDTDNLAKIILDSLNGLAYKDDSQVVELSVKKWYSEVPKVLVTIMEVQND